MRTRLRILGAVVVTSVGASAVPILTSSDDDAAYAAGRYLCADGGDLTQGTAWQQAVFSYNHAASYVAAVYAAAVRFSDG